MTTAASRRMTAVALSGWLAFAVVWVQQPPGAAPPPPPVPPAVLVSDAAIAPAGGGGGGGGGGGSVAPALAGDDIIEIPLGATPKMRGSSFLPPNANPTGAAFSASFPKAWAPPERLGQFSYTSVSTAMDWHYAMMNDIPRNEAYEIALQEACKGKVVLDVGSGSGLLAMLAAKAGAEHVYTVEANPDFAKLASEIVDLNHLKKKITVVNTLSTKVEVKKGIAVGGGDVGASKATASGTRYIHKKADVLVAEIIGTLLLSESQLDYIEDARSKLLVDGGVIIPASGRQFVTLIQMPMLDKVFQIDHYRGLDLRPFNRMRDTVSMAFSKINGFHLRTAPYTEMSPKISVQEVDFYTTTSDSLPSKRAFRVRMQHSGVVHAALATWDLSTVRSTDELSVTGGTADEVPGESDVDKQRFAKDRREPTVISTDPRSFDHFERDNSWGQAIQLLENQDGTPIMVEAGDWVQVTVQFTKLSMHVDIAPAMAVGRRRRAEQQHAQPSPSEVWEEEIEHEDEDEGKGRGGAEAGLRGSNESDTDMRSKRRRDWVRLDD